MNVTRLEGDRNRRTYAIVLAPGDEVVGELTAFAREAELTAAHFTAIGAFRDAVLAYFDAETNEYEEIPVDAQVEVASLVGNVAVHADEPKMHIHCVLARRDGSAVAGHLMRAHVRPTLEVFLDESAARLERTVDERTGLPLIDLEAAR